MVVAGVVVTVAAPLEAQGFLLMRRQVGIEGCRSVHDNQLIPGNRPLEGAIYQGNHVGGNDGELVEGLGGGVHNGSFDRHLERGWWWSSEEVVRRW